MQRQVIPSRFFKFCHSEPVQSAGEEPAFDLSGLARLLTSQAQPKRGCPISRVLCEKWAVRSMQRQVIPSRFFKFCHSEPVQSTGEEPAFGLSGLARLLISQAQPKRGCPISRVLCEKWAVRGMQRQVIPSRFFKFCHSEPVQST